MSALIHKHGKLTRAASMAALLSTLLAACAESEPEPAEPLAPEELLLAQYREDAAALRRGRDLFLGSCVSFCHNPAEETPEPAAAAALSLFDCQWTHAADHDGIFQVIKRGIPGTPMVGFGDNFPDGDSDIWKIIAYLEYSRGDCGESEAVSR